MPRVLARPGGTGQFRRLSKPTKPTWEHVETIYSGAKDAAVFNLQDKCKEFEERRDLLWIEVSEGNSPVSCPLQDSQPQTLQILSCFSFVVCVFTAGVGAGTPGRCSQVQSPRPMFDSF